jgi:hypothetical protein
LREIHPRKKRTLFSLPQYWGNNRNPVKYKLIRRNIDIGTLNREKKFLCYLVDTRDDGDDLYLMAYEAVCEYSNKVSSTFNEYQFPYLVVREGDDQILTEEGTLYSLTPTEEWTRVDDDDNNGRTIDPIEWTGGNEEFSIKITDEELKTLKDDSSNNIKIYFKYFRKAVPLTPDPFTRSCGTP